MKNLARTFRLFLLVALTVLTINACSGPTTPTPPNNCPVGGDVTVRVRYQRQVAKVKPDSTDAPNLYYRVLDAGLYKTIFMSKVDYYTWTLTLSLPENRQNSPHAIHVFDPALLPASAITASDIFANDVLVAKGPSPSGNGEYGSFRVDGCGVVTVK